MQRLQKLERIADWSVEWSAKRSFALQLALQSTILSGVLFGVHQSPLQKYWGDEKGFHSKFKFADWSVDCTPKKPECPKPCLYVEINI